jgi:quinol monooxygenase YgiN
MPFFVAIHYEASPDRLDSLVEAIRNDFAASPTLQPGRRFARLFQHLQDPARLLAMEEWQSQPDFERHLQDAAYADALASCGPTLRADALERLQHYRHMPHLPSALSCITLSTSLDRAADVEGFICDDERRDALVAAGLVLRAVYRVVGSPGRLLVLHGWRSFDDLERYLATSEHSLAELLETTDASIERFTGQMAAQFSWLES